MAEAAVTTFRLRAIPRVPTLNVNGHLVFVASCIIATAMRYVLVVRTNNTSIYTTIPHFLTSPAGVVAKCCDD